MNTSPWTALLAASLTAATLALCGPAGADTQDDQFLAALAAQGITGQPDQLIAAAHNMCDVAGGMGAIGPFYRLLASQSLSPMQASAVFAAGAQAYCPEKSAVIGRMPS